MFNLHIKIPKRFSNMLAPMAWKVCFLTSAKKGTYFIQVLVSDHPGARVLILSTSKALLREIYM
jgi:hypothetical protein